MRPTSLLALSEGFRAVPEELRAAFESQLCEREKPLSEVKPHEAASVVALVDALRAVGTLCSHDYEGFVFSFRIPQISSEFDLLKITDDAVINVELKSEGVGMARIGAQLARNRYYLAPLERTVYTFTYVASDDALYELGDGRRSGHDAADRAGAPDAGAAAPDAEADLPDAKNHVVRVSMRRLARVVAQAGIPYDGVVEDLFKVSNYLVSPLNDTERFLAESYFLTNHQAQIKAAFMRACSTAGRDVARETPAFVVYGSAGTGKTLLLYDLARTLAQTRRTCIIHCGVLSEGHEALNRSQDGFCIIAAKHCERESFAEFGAIFIDEAQRMWPRQLASVVRAAKAHGTPLYLSLDRLQVLTPHDGDFDLQTEVQSAFGDVSVFQLSRRIRTNRELSEFVRALFGLRGAPRVARTRHVKVSCALDVASARCLVDSYVAEGYQFIAMAGEPDKAVAVGDSGALPTGPLPTQVIGQEFDKVVMAVGPAFVPSEQGGLMTASLFQGLTRARDDIALVVYDNEQMLRHVLETTGALAASSQTR